MIPQKNRIASIFCIPLRRYFFDNFSAISKYVDGQDAMHIPITWHDFAVYHSNAEILTAMLVDLPVWGANCSKISFTLKKNYDFTSNSCVFLDKFATPLPSFHHMFICYATAITTLYLLPLPTVLSVIITNYYCIS